MVKVDIEARKKSGLLTYEEIMQVVASEKHFEETEICYPFEEIQMEARKMLFFKAKSVYLK